MRNVTARTGKLFPGPRGVGFSFGRVPVTESVPREDVFARSLAVVAGTTEFVHWFFKKGIHVRGVGGVAGCALAGGNRRVNVLLREYSLVMTGIAQVRRFRGQELCVLACMRIMTARTAHSYGGVHELFAEQRFVMAIEAKVRLPGGKPFCVLICYFMRDVFRIHGSMACGTSHGNCCMDAFAFGEFLVALKAIDLRRCCVRIYAEQRQERTRQNKNCSHEDRFSTMPFKADKKCFVKE